jgi:G patch domain-containing protein 2
MSGEERRMFAKTKRVALQALHGLQPPANGPTREKFAKGKSLGTKKGRSEEWSRERQKSSRSAQRSGGKSKEGRAPVYANKPVSFTATGVMSEDGNPPTSSPSSFRAMPSSVSSLRVVAQTKVVSGEFALFEAHTKGFGSRMMAKMGYSEGCGLGRDKQGISQPLEAIKRPKSLGLGAHA